MYLNINLNAEAKLLKLRGVVWPLLKNITVLGRRFSLYSGVWDSGKVFYKVGS